MQILHKFGEVVLADVVTGEKDAGTVAWLQPAEVVAQSLEHGAGTEIAAADASHYNGLAVLTQHIGAFVDLSKECCARLAWQVHPTQEVVAGAGALLKGFVGGGN